MTLKDLMGQSLTEANTVFIFDLSVGCSIYGCLVNSKINEYVLAHSPILFS